MLDGKLFILRTGAPWRCLPPVFPPWQTVYRWFASLHDRSFSRRLITPSSSLTVAVKGERRHRLLP
ncbi:transposase [Sphingobium sp.]|uniref:transposase n=1 Tax=Sphingobium sp. TaxID=1912891 RepID=UPI003BB81627